AGRSETMEDAAAIDEAEVVAAEARDLVSVFEFGEANQFARERLADEDEFAPPFDFAGGADPARLVVGVIPGLVDPLGHGAWGRCVELGRGRLAQRLVGTFLVVMAAELVEARLLFARVGGRRLRGLRLQRAMHAFVTSVLLWRSGTDEMRLDAQLEPPDGKPCESPRAARTERR